MSTLYIRLPSKSAAGSVPHWPSLPCQFALVSHRNSIERQGEMPLPDLSDVVASAKRVVLLLAAVDVTLLRMKVPALSTAKLKAALPNIVEDQLIADPTECAVVADGMSDGLRTIAVVQRAWLDTLDKTLTALGARQVSALPGQLCLPYQATQPDEPNSVVAALDKFDGSIDVSFRLAEHDGIGLTISTDLNGSAAREAVQALCAIVPKASITLYVPQSEIRTYQEALNDGGVFGKRISILADNWPLRISGASTTTLDLMAGLGSRAGQKLEFREWRWPIILAAAFFFVNIAALNIDWWRMKAEATSLRSTMIQIYKSAFPKETIIIDPVAQMQQKIEGARINAGQAAPDDFITITTVFGGAWESAGAASGRLPAIAALEYRERSLFVRLKPFPAAGADTRESEALAQKMKATLAERNLSLEQVRSEPETTWKIRSVK